MAKVAAAFNCRECGRYTVRWVQEGEGWQSVMEACLKDQRCIDCEARERRAAHGGYGDGSLRAGGLRSMKVVP